MIWICEPACSIRKPSLSQHDGFRCKKRRHGRQSKAKFSTGLCDGIGERLGSIRRNKIRSPLLGFEGGNDLLPPRRVTQICC